VTDVVAFRARGAAWAIEVEHVRRVHAEAEVVALPDPRPGVEGVMAPTAGGEALPVLTMLQSAGRHLLEVDACGRRFALRVDEVLGVRRDVVLSPAPDGQDDELACAVVTGVGPSGDAALLLDAEAVARRLSRAPLPSGDPS
jgi:chemotaxis signal transduction protein